ncbi:GIY-YIG nuclease family protein [Streptomyces sp. NBC_01707]|uniref:GIY-YIG nuclease family protein n=1 Tax=Streptomyces sp. NBC_01707 TaxID=2975914 RepID=UPI00352D4420
MWLDDCRTALYRLYDEGGALLYVGITADVDQRMVAHRYDKPWWPDVTRTEVQWHDSRPVALAHELQAIRAESPKHNVNGKPGAGQPRELEDREITIGQGKHVMFAIERGFMTCDQPLFVVDGTKRRERIGAIVSADFYRRALAALGETAVPA